MRSLRWPRFANLAAGRDDTDVWPRYLVVIDERLNVSPPLVAQLLSAGSGVAVMWLGSDRGRVPSGCGVILESDADGLQVWFADPARHSITVAAEVIDTTTAASFARALAPLRDAAALSAAVPSDVRLGALWDNDLVTPLAVRARWAAADRSMLRVPIGRSSRGDYTIDFVNDGPHALVAGTSGAGKSELLQTLVMGLALGYSPEHVNILFIDYKGGASSAVFAGLAHHVGSVTNLDPLLANRALLSLRAELSARMAWLDGRGRDLDEAHAAGHNTPPRLVIVVDEFATLVQEIPEFVTGIVDIAQRGRSLGIHLVLATQRPTGVVSDKILANTNIRVALRLLDSAESVSIVGTDDAARLAVSQRGRAFVRGGDGSAVEVQVGWAGGSRQTDLTTVHVRRLGERRAASSTGGGTDLSAALATVAAASIGARPPSRPWLEPLTDRLVLELVPPARSALLGLLDRPHAQRQDPAVIDFAQTGGLLVLGATGAGTTTALARTVTSYLARHPGSTVLTLVAFRRGSQELERCSSTLAALDDLETLTRAVAWLADEVARRRRSAEGPADDVLVVIDGVSLLWSSLDRPDLHMWADLLLDTITQGRGVGVYVLASAERRQGVPAALLTMLSGNRLVLRHGDAEGLIDAGIPPAVARAAELVPGRGWLNGEPIHVVLAIDDVLVGPCPLPPTLPETFELPARRAAKYGEVAIGVEDMTGTTVCVDFGLDHVVVVGPPGSGRTTALRQIEAGARIQGLEVLGLDEDRLVPLLDERGRAVRAIVVVDDAEHTEHLPMVERVMRSGSVRLAVAVDLRILTGGFVPGWLGECRRWRQHVVLQPTANDLMQLVGPRTHIRPGVEWCAGRAMLITPRATRLMQIAQPAMSGVAGQA